MHPSLSSPPALSSINNFHTAPNDTNKFSGLHSLSFSTPELLVLNGHAPPRGPHVVAINPPLVRAGSRRTLRSQSHRQGFSKHGRAWMKGLDLFSPGRVSWGNIGRWFTQNWPSEKPTDGSLINPSWTLIFVTFAVKIHYYLYFLYCFIRKKRQRLWRQIPKCTFSLQTSEIAKQRAGLMKQQSQQKQWDWGKTGFTRNVWHVKQQLTAAGVC